MSTKQESITLSEAHTKLFKAHSMIYGVEMHRIDRGERDNTLRRAMEHISIAMQLITNVTEG